MRYLTVVLLLLLPYLLKAQNGGACIYLLPGDGTIVCNVYGNAGVPSENDCHTTATALGALPLNCPDYLNGCSSAYTTTGTSCFFIGSGSCNASTICANITLPVELVEFKAINEGRLNLITWVTSSEYNAAYYTLIIYSEDMDAYNSYTIPAEGTTQNITNYKFIHHNPKESINYYQLLQYDLDGEFKDYGYISINNRPKEISQILDLTGRETTLNNPGFKILIFTDGTQEKIIR